MRNDCSHHYSSVIAKGIFQSGAAAPMNCCPYCNPVLVPKGKYSLSSFRDFEGNCQFCALIGTIKSGSGDQLFIRTFVGKWYHNGQYRFERLWICPGDISGYFERLQRWLSRGPKFSAAPTLEMVSQTTSSIQFQLLRQWLHHCNDSHNCNKRTAEVKAFLPTRLIFVGNTTDPDLIRLTLSTELEETNYTALSHRWGTLLDAETRKFCTTTDNIGHRMRGFNISDLPKTFQDAIRVTRELGVQYLWIDSLCIIQHGDDKKDWDKESTLMESVHTSAHCTIAATSAKDMKDGFLDRDTRPKFSLVQDTSGRQFYVCVGTYDFEADVNEAELNTRAWVVQERYLSRRIIHFSASQLYWECGEGVCCGNLIHMQGSRKGFFFMHDSQFPNRLRTSGYYKTLEFVESLFKDYSNCRLTKDIDKAVAISGPQDRIARTLGSECRYGILQMYLHRNLLWHAPNSKLKRITYRAQNIPSWSWMAYSGGFQYISIPFGRVEWLDNPRFDSERKLALIAEVRKFQNCTTKQVERRHVIVDSRGVERGWIDYDVKNVKDLSRTRCVFIGRYKNAIQVATKRYYMLVVKPASVDGEYKRVGSGTIHQDYVMRKPSIVRIV